MIGWLKRLLLQPGIRGYQPIPPTRLDPPPMPRVKTERIVTDWDVAQAFEAPARESGQIEYRFLGMTGEEDA